MPASKGQTGGKPTDLPTTATTGGKPSGTSDDDKPGRGPGGTATTGTTSGSDDEDSTAPAWPTVDAAIQKLFTLFDTDEDGSIAVSEIAALLDPKGHHADLNAVVRRFIDQVDTDEDDSLSNEEVTTALTKLDSNEDGSLTPADLGADVALAGSAPLLAALLQGAPLPGGGGSVPKPPAPVGPPKAPTVDQVVEVLITRFDADKDSSLTLDELLAVLDPKGKHGKVEDALQHLVTAVDASGEGKLSEAELTAAISTLDVDGSGAIDHRDHVPGPPTDDSIDLIGLLMPRMRDFDIATLGQVE